MQTVVGVFDSMDEAQEAREALLSAGFDDDQVHVQSHASYATEGGADTDLSDRTDRQDGHRESQGFMASVGRFFSDLFGGEDEHASHYSEAVRRGATVVTVDASDERRVEDARETLARAGAVDIEKRAQAWREEGYQSFDPAAQPYSAEEAQAERQKVLPVIREELEVGKREVDLGVVRVHARTETRPVREEVQLREQHADIERRQVDRPATEADLKAFGEGSIEVRETAERAVVSKTARVVEEVSVGTDTSTRTETVEDQVRNTVVDVDKVGGSRDMDNSADDHSRLYRAHYDQNYASQGRPYEEYEPAYRYGSSLRSDERYANRNWDEVEKDAQRDWGQRYPSSNWERSKQAVRHGWESMTGRR
jgi:stress response protein YsnF